MQDEARTREQLLAELSELRKRVAELEKDRARSGQAEGTALGRRAALPRGETDAVIVTAAGAKPAEDADRKAAVDALRMQSLVLEQIQDMVTVTDLEGRITYVNDASCHMLGRTRQELIGRHVAICGEDSAAGATQAEIIRETLEKGRWRGQVVNFDGSGRPVFLDCRTHLVTGAGGEPVAMCGISTDITERRHAEQMLRRSEERYRMLAEHSLQGIAVLRGLPPVFDYVNPTWTEIFGYTADEVMSFGPEQVWDLVHPEDREMVRGRNHDRLRGMPAIPRYEFRIVRKDGAVRWVEVFVGVLDSGGEPVCQAVYVDTTERKRAEDALSESEESYRTLVENSTDVVLRFDRECRHVYAGPSVAAVVGMEPEAFIGKTHRELGFPPELCSYWEDRILSVFDTGRAVREEFEVEAVSGKVHFDWKLVPEYGTDGKVVRVLSVARDITDRKRKEDEIHAANELLLKREKEIQSLLNVARLALENYTFEATAHFLFQECKLHTGATAGYVALLSESGDENEVLFLDAGGRKCVVDPSLPMPIRGLREQSYLRMETVYENDFEHSEWRQYLPAGHVRMQNVMFAPLRIEGRTLGVIGLANKADAFTEEDSRIAAAFGDMAALALKNSRTVDALKESEQRYRLLFQNLTSGFALHEVIADEDGLPRDYRFLQVNPAFETLTGLKADRIVGRTVLDTIPGVEPYWIDTYGRVALTGKAVRFENYSRSLRRYYDITAYSPEQGHFATIFTDITDRKLAEAALRSSEERFRLLVENAPEAIFVHTRGCFAFLNPAALELYGADSVEQILGRPVLDMIHPDYHHSARERMRLLNEEKKAVPLMEQKFIRLDGTAVDVEVSAVPLTFEGSNGALVFVRDITERKQAEVEREQMKVHLRHAQKLEAVGTLAGGIAHDFNNILSPIIGYTEMALQDLPSDHPMRSDLEEVVRAALRARELVKQILAFSRHGRDQQRAPTEIGAIVEEALQLLRASLPTTIEIKTNIEGGMALADATQIHQVLINLCTNAAHAMEDRGTLEVGLAAVNLSRDDLNSLAILGLKPGPHLRLRVKDNGHGMDEATMERIFDPYFTTKEVGKGSGLGLAVVHGIVKRHDGAISVRSRKGQGATFDLYIPKIDARKMSAGAANEAFPTGTERILFVDDERAVTNLGTRILDRLGYRVTSTTSSRGALELFRSMPHEFDLVVTDYTMPDLTGAELAREVLKIRPDIPIILCTGFSERVTEATAADCGIMHLALKPLEIKQLARLVRQSLDAKKS